MNSCLDRVTLYGSLYLELKVYGHLLTGLTNAGLVKYQDIKYNSFIASPLIPEEGTNGYYMITPTNIPNIVPNPDWNFRRKDKEYDLKNRRVVLKFITVTKKPEAATGYADFGTFVKDRKPHLADPDTFILSEVNDIYFQWNKVNVQIFSEPVIRYYYDTLVRYWAKGHAIEPKHFGKKNKTGWRQTTGFGISGIHPAMTYDFVSNFNILPDVWKAITKGGEVNTLDVDQLNVRPMDKIRESIFGNPTEIAPSNSDTEKPYGNEFNYFRPRLIMLLPKSHASTLLPIDFKEFALFDMTSMTSFDFIQNLAKQMDFAFYTTPMGDIILEPRMYDMHPLHFLKNPAFPLGDYTMKAYNKIEKRNIIKKGFGAYNEVGKAVTFRAIKYTNTSGDQKLLTREDFAYNFNSKANHPFFIMEKDRTDFNDTFNSDMLRTSLTVMGMPFNLGGNALFSDFVREMNTFTKDMKTLTLNKDPDPSAGASNLLFPGLYIADGFLNSMRVNNPQDVINQSKENLRKKLETSQKIYNKQLNDAFDKFIKVASSLQSLIDKSTTAMSNLAQETTFINLSGFKSVLAEFASNNIYKPEPENRSGIYTQFVTEQSNYLELYTKTLFAMLNALYSFEVQKSEAQKKAIESTTDFLSSYINPYIQTELAKLDFTPSLTKYLEAKVIDRFSKTGTEDKKIEDIISDALQLDIKNLYEPVFLLESEDNKKLYIDMKQLEKDCNIEVTNVIQTVADLKQLEKLGLYNPGKDLVSRYGILPAGTINNLFVTNGPQAITFAKIMFNRYIAEAHQFRITCIGRPEFMLNRPYYVEHKKSIGLCKQHSIAWAFASDFMSTVELTYIRENKITYKYAKENLDEISTPNKPSIEGTIEDFYNEAKDYYNSMNIMNNLKDMTKKATDEVTSGAYSTGLTGAGGLVALAAGAAAEVGASVVDDTINKFFPTGGIYVAHDHIGHIDFDKTGKEEESLGRIKEPKSQETSDSPLMQATLGQYFITKSQVKLLSHNMHYLHDELKKLITFENNWKTMYNNQKQKTQEYDKLTQDILEIEKKPLSDLGIPEGLTVDQYRKLYSDESNLASQLVQIKNNVEAQKPTYADMTKFIYGQTDVTFDLESGTRSNNIWNYNIFNNTTGIFVPCVMTTLYQSIPEKDVNGQYIKDKFTIVDDKKAVGFIEIAGEQYFNYISNAPAPLGSAGISLL